MWYRFSGHQGTNNVFQSTETYYNTSVYYFFGIFKPHSGPLSHFTPYFRYVQQFLITISVTNVLDYDGWKQKLAVITSSKQH